jgi:hypothetical protein
MARAMTSSGKPWREKALVERAVKRRPQSLHRQRWPPKRVSPSFRVRSLPHRIHVIASPFRHIQGWQLYCPSRCNKTSKDEADRIFNALAAGGTIEMPMADQPWGDYYGSLTDQFGVQWMVNYSRG